MSNDKKIKIGEVGIYDGSPARNSPYADIGYSAHLCDVRRHRSGSNSDWS